MIRSRLSFKNEITPKDSSQMMDLLSVLYICSEFSEFQTNLTASIGLTQLQTNLPRTRKFQNKRCKRRLMQLVATHTMTMKTLLKSYLSRELTTSIKSTSCCSSVSPLPRFCSKKSDTPALQIQSLLTLPPY